MGVRSRIKVRGGLYQDVDVLRTDNKMYQKLLGISLIATLGNPPIIKTDDGSLYSGVVVGLDRSLIPPNRWWSNEDAKFDLNLDTAGCAWSINLLMPENITYDLLSPVGDGLLQLLVYGVNQRPNAEPVKTVYQSGEFPFKDGRQMCQHMIDTWGRRSVNWLI